MKRLLCLLLVLACTLPAPAQESALDRVARTGVLRVGTTADYRPFSSREGSEYVGYDVDIARLAADALGARVEFVPTTWGKLTADMQAGKFDLAVGGITRTLKRQQVVGFSDPVMTLGKCALVRAADAHKYSSPETIDREGVTVAVNPGGTNEAYARAHLKRATIKMVPDNLEIPGMLARGEADVMVTDSVEALQAARQDSRLAVVGGDHPWTTETLGFMTARQDQALLNWLNLFLYQAEADGRLKALREKYGV